jgi:hypothetical protein
MQVSEYFSNRSLISSEKHFKVHFAIIFVLQPARRRPAPRSAPFSSPWTPQQRVVMPPIKPWPGKRPAKSPQNRHHLMIHSEAGGRRRVNFSSHPRALTKALADASDLRQVIGLGLGLWCLSPLSTIFQLYHGGQFYWWRQPRAWGENHRPVASHWKTLSHNVVHLVLIEIQTHNISGDKHRLHR